MTLKILVIGAENPRIRDLFRAVGPGADVSYLEIRPITRRPSISKLLRSGRWHTSRSNDFEATLYLPRRWGKIETRLSNWFCRRSFAKHGKPDVVVFTWPHLAPLAERFADVKRVYYCKDPFECWHWGPEIVRPLETRLLNNVDAVFAVSRALVEDFQPRTRGKVFYSPNAVDGSFLGDRRPRPANLPLGKPVLGSVGQINATFDWDYVGQLAAALPEVQLCFVGGVDENNSFFRDKIIQQLTTTPNILWLGHQPHGELPAYLQNFDISICYLKAGHFADRRSPLRLYDYLSTDRPVITTAVREAREHLPHLHIAETAQDAAKTVREILAGKNPVDQKSRQAYIARHTWAVRGKELMEQLRQVL